MIDTFLHATLGGLLRFAEAIMASGPTLLVGLFIAAIFRYYLGTEGTKRLFGGDSIRSLPQSWAIGMLLPVCSIGVLPVLLEMRRSRIKAGAMSAFALSAPLFNPLSLLYGLTLSRPYVIVMFAVGSLAVVTVVGLIWDAYSRRSETSSQIDEEEITIGGAQRLLALVVYMCRQLCGPAGLWALLAATGMFLLAAVLPWGALQSGVSRDDWVAPARMAAVAVPAYATPMMIMSQLGMMFQHANSPGAAFVLLVLGAGMNFGTIGWLGKQFGVRSVATWFGCLMLVVVGIAYAINKPLIPPGVDPSDHTHAFDVYSNPIHHLDSATGSFAKEKLKEKIGIAEQITLRVLGALLLMGAVFRLLGWTLEKPWSGYSTKESEVADKDRYGKYDRAISPRTVGATLLVGLVVLSVVMCYAYYPSTDECLEEIRFIRADALTGALSGDVEHAMFWIPRWDEWSRRLEVGTFLRRGKVTPYQRMQGYLIRKKLEMLEHELAHEHDEPEMIRVVVQDITATDLRWVRAFRNLPPPKSLFDGVSSIEAGFDSEHGHEHIHGEAHDHDHDHSHHHDDGPHGGQIVLLKNEQGQAIDNLRLEVMPVTEGKIQIYPLKEQLGVLRPIKDPASTLVLRFGEGPDSIVSKSSDVKLELDPSNWVFQAAVPDALSSADDHQVLAVYAREDGTEFRGIIEDQPMS